MPSVALRSVRMSLHIPAIIDKPSRLGSVGKAKSNGPKLGFGTPASWPIGKYIAPFVESTTDVVGALPKNGKGNGSATCDVTSSPRFPTIVPLFGAVSAAGALVVTIYGSEASAGTVTFRLAVLVLPALSVKRSVNWPDGCLKGILKNVDVMLPGKFGRSMASRNFSFETASVKKNSLRAPWPVMPSSPESAQRTCTRRPSCERIS